MSSEYMTEEEIASYNPPDFNSKAQFQLSNFITLPNIYRRKIPYKSFVDFNDLVYDHREELRDQEYIDIMEHLSRLLPNVSPECICSPDTCLFCHSGIDEFLYCQNYSKWSAMMPQIEFIRFSRDHPNYSYNQFTDFLKKYCTEPLQIRIGVNPNINNKVVIHNLIQLCATTPICFVGRALLIIMNIKFCLENIQVFSDDPQQTRDCYNSIFKKMVSSSKECVSPITQLLRKILGWSDCPFKTIQQLMIANRHIPGFEDIPANI
jgi:hypothetical protein